MTAKIKYVVQCNKHGAESTEWAGKQVVVTKPKGKKDRFGGGCPYCANERKAAEKTAATT